MEQGLQTIEPQESSIFSIIANVSKDPNVSVEIMEKLVSLQLRVMDEEKEIELNKALAKLEPKITTLIKTKAGAKTKDGHIKFYYTPYEDIDKMLRPALRECGISLSFTTRVVGDKTYFVAQAQEKTKGGIRESMIPYTPDTSTQMNQPQNVASGLSFAQRVTVKLLFNLVFEGEDDNANAAGFLTTSEFGIIERLISERDVDRAAFLKFCGVSETTDIPSSLFKEAKSKLEQKPFRKQQ